MQKTEQFIVDLLLIVLSALSIGACAQLSINLGDVFPVPITAQSLAVLLIAHLIGWQKGALAIFLYILAGGMGAPIFSNAASGWEVVMGKSAGYLIGFLLAALVVGKLSHRNPARFGYYLLHIFVGHLIILAAGAVGLLSDLSVIEALKYGVVPFIAGGIIKTFIAAIILSLYRRFRQLIRSGKDEALN